MANYVIHRADTRGKVDWGWLQSCHTFSFGNYYNPERMHFGVLRGNQRRHSGSRTRIRQTSSR